MYLVIVSGFTSYYDHVNNLLPTDCQIAESLYHPTSISSSPILLRRENKNREGKKFRSIYTESQ